MGKFELNFRQVHLDFHTSPLIEGVGRDFNAEEFVDTLEKARVNSVTCFARCHHGMIYYDSKINPERIHPHLVNKNLLKEQIEACHKRGIRVPIYITVQWDYYTAQEHPEWLSVNEDGSIIGSPEDIVQKPFEPGFYHTLCVNSPYRDFLKAHTKEVLETFHPVDGLFFDIVFPVGCACRHCRQGMVEKGLKPHNDMDRSIYSQMTIDEFQIDMTNFVRQYSEDCSIFYNKGHIGTAHRSVTEAFTHFELESLPSGLWGYLHFPITMRYGRNLGLDCLAQTGKFHTMWGDFHSFKNMAALEFECFNMLALNAKCLIGDQLDPNGKLSEPVYQLIGGVYSEIEKKEPWCKAAKPVTEIGVFTSEEYEKRFNRDLTPSLRGVTRMLQEGAHQFDIIDTKSDLSLYRLLLLPDEIPVSEEFAVKLDNYIRNGGAVIASFESGLDAAKSNFNLKELGVRLKEEATRDLDGNLVRGENYPVFNYADYIIPKGDIGKGLPETEHVMYMKGLEVEALAGSEVLADVILSCFDRTYEHFCSHRQTPSSGKTGYQGIVRNGKVIYFAHPIFKQYHQNAPRWCKQLFLNAVEMLIPDPVLKHNGPSTMLTAVNEQVKEKRLIVHLLHYIPERRAVDLDIIEDVIPLYNISLILKPGKEVDSVICVPQGKEIEFRLHEGGIAFTVPEVQGHQMIALNYK
ncbi:alpha-L-fucosidase [Paenibacillus andongensis]|uniref:alpha-L-fucosidase n=1 Tax=Paenibacillus andongensis TaxID=2975482 RepID=UPI0021BB2F28|nr:alpha-L-fucosidase [Paenibacillus andongensis]